MTDRAPKNNRPIALGIYEAIFLVYLNSKFTLIPTS
jgi:hypothetical protein